MSKILILQACNEDLQSFWRNTMASNWSGKNLTWSIPRNCGYGIIQNIESKGNYTLNCNYEVKWLVIEVDTNNSEINGNMINFSVGNVVFCGDHFGANEYIRSRKENGIIKISGDYGSSTTEYEGTSISGFEGTSVSGKYGTSISGNYGTSISGKYGTSISGYKGTSISGYGGSVSSGYYGSIQIKYYVESTEWYKIKTGYIGEDGLLPNVPYVLDENNNFKRKE